jgi:citrate lyase subunit beta/citryl-CoA lyase
MMVRNMNGFTTERLRSWMFVPGYREKFLEKAKTTPADGVLLDLEDGVLPAEKANARRMIAAALAEGRTGPVRFVRVNALSTPWLDEDLEHVVRPGIDGICLTKVSSAEDILEVSSKLNGIEKRAGMEVGGVRMLAAIESAAGLINAPSIASADPRVAGIMFGAEDYALDVGLGTRRENEAAELIYARSAIVVAATAARVSSIDGVFPDLDNPDGLLKETIQARNLGFTSKSTFNPRQIEVINEIFSPTPAEIEFARKVRDAFNEAEQQGDASIAVDGQLVDRPVVLRAIRLLETIEDRG